MRSNPERLADIKEAAELVQEYAARGREAFESDRLIQVWIVHYLQIIGEAARGLSKEFTESHPDIPWPKIIGMRNILVHNYFGIDTDVVWSVVENDLQDLIEKVGTMLDPDDRR